MYQQAMSRLLGPIIMHKLKLHNFKLHNYICILIYLHSHVLFTNMLILCVPVPEAPRNRRTNIPLLLTTLNVCDVLSWLKHYVHCIYLNIFIKLTIMIKPLISTVWVWPLNDLVKFQLNYYVQLQSFLPRDHCSMLATYMWIHCAYTYIYLISL